MKKNKTNKQVKSVKADTLSKLGEILVSAPEVTSAPALPAPAPVVEIPAPVIESAPANDPAPWGKITHSKRVTPGARIDTYRVVGSQRKTDSARYYVQGGYSAPHVNNELRMMFTVAVEIPHVDLRTAQLQCKELNQALKSAVQLSA